ncbi:MAG: hypothetical protein ACI8UO_006357 [Verrucomicrobiales bacterium]|jgi:hypothetical protein
MSPAQIGMTTHIPGRAGNERPRPKGGPRDADSLNHLPLELPSYARELKKLGYAPASSGSDIWPEKAQSERKMESSMLTGIRSTMDSIAI